MNFLEMHEISEAGHRILNPFSEAKLMQLGEVCRLRPGSRQLDLACGKAEMICQWARRWGIRAVGVDLSHVFLAAARARAAELGVADRITLVQGDAGKPIWQPEEFDLVSCIGATWIGGGLLGTIELMRPALRADGLMLVGEPFWVEEPPLRGREDFSEITTLGGTLDRFDSAGMELVELVVADGDSWDRYYGAQWWTVDRWLADHPESPDRAALREFMVRQRRGYVDYQRRCMGWGVFVLRAA